MFGERALYASRKGLQNKVEERAKEAIRQLHEGKDLLAYVLYIFKCGLLNSIGHK